ncbi:MAG: 16S rRNA (guanine(966)-N(2))-methyltransferase RsmD [Kiritimatiellae bacterium]|nr:16S rRNA (guanine(966)-N(2))-methyltransferase RsmD [Kiritimatiellia bacterium]
MGLIRITGGQWGGRRIRVPPRGVRPTSDRVRQGVFSSLAAAMPGARVLDLFAGSGAYGIEALSRGAAAACWVERDRAACAKLTENLRALMPAGPLPADWRVICADATRPDSYQAFGPFDLIFADPPYRFATEPSRLLALLRALAAAPILRPGGALVLELSRRTPLPPTADWTVERAHTVGESQWIVLRRTSAPACADANPPLC